MANRKILVTGANGFIGRHLVARLIRAGHNVRAFVLPEEIIPESWNSVVETVRGDVTDRVQVQAAVENADAVFHLAAIVTRRESDAAFAKININGARHVLEAAAANGARAVLLSSIAIYGSDLDRDVCDENHPFGPALGPYGRSKQAQERIVLELAQMRSLKATIVRAGCVFGPGSFAWVDMFVHILRHRLPVMVSDGRHAAALCCVENLVEVMALVLEKPEAVGRIYNAVDEGWSWHAYLCDLAAAAEAPAPLAMPRWVARAGARGDEWRSRFFPRPDNLAFTRESFNLISARGSVPAERARRELGFSPPVTRVAAMQKIKEYIHEASL
jgi:nucleoside-diphosphate-sugar epimerase